MKELADAGWGGRFCANVEGNTGADVGGNIVGCASKGAVAARGGGARAVDEGGGRAVPARFTNFLNSYLSGGNLVSECVLHR